MKKRVLLTILGGTNDAPKIATHQGLNPLAKPLWLQIVYLDAQWQWNISQRLAQACLSHCLNQFLEVQTEGQGSS